TMAGNLVAIGATSLGVFGLVFVMLGFQIAAMNVSNLNVMLEFAPGPAAQPTYVGLGTTLLAPVAFGAPIAAGLLADARGFVAVFVVAALAASVALALLLTRVRDPHAAGGLSVTSSASRARCAARPRPARRSSARARSCRPARPADRPRPPAWCTSPGARPSRSGSSPAGGSARPACSPT